MNRTLIIDRALKIYIKGEYTKSMLLFFFALCLQGVNITASNMYYARTHICNHVSH